MGVLSAARTPSPANGDTFPCLRPGTTSGRGLSCYCGRSGCIETFLCGAALRREYAALEKAAAPEIEPPEIVRRATLGEAAAVAVLARYADRLARGTAMIINIIDPDVIVLGGGLSNITALYDMVPRLWPHSVFSDAIATRLTPPRHGDASGVRGAAWLWP